MKDKNLWQIEHYHTLPSTNDYCIEQAAVKNRGNLAVLADMQTRPRGSRGRQWIEPHGNLAFSLLYWPRFSIDRINWISFVAGLALYDAVKELCKDKTDIIIKWPNDLLFENKKIGGILIESNMDVSSENRWVVAGFGLNIKSAPEINKKVGCLGDFIQIPPSNLEISQKVREYFDYWVDYLIKNETESIRHAWLKRGLPLYTPLFVNLSEKQWKGIYCGINEQGLLLLETETGLRKFSTGEVFWSYKEQE